jgi:hypothetical protein
MPIPRPRRKSGAVTSCPKDTGGAELHTRSTEANGFDRTARLGRTGHKGRTPRLVGVIGPEGKTERSRIASPPLRKRLAVAARISSEFSQLWLYRLEID